MSGPDPTPAAWSPLVISVAPTGARRSKADHPALPMEIAEIAAAAAACRDAGAAMLHLHVRDRDGAHLLDAEAYRETTAAIRSLVGEDLIVQVTSEAAGRYRPDEQIAVIRETRPEAVSIALKEIIPSPEWETPAAELLADLHRDQVMVQYIVFSTQGITRFHDLRRRGIVPGDRHFLLFVLGRYSMGQTSVPDDLLPYLAVHDRRDDWALCAFGPRESACTLAAAALGGHARVGFENNLMRSDGEVADSNADLVSQLCAGAALMGRPVADAALAREGLSEGPSGRTRRAAGRPAG
ncbi:MAG: 3-keto-5-aminohexanoate cleavage protein [Alphaproteobacteria bacterium]|nr:3-keto-5-aminohexanoate cleavage protein [Alphaproteobacteria bacterium]